MISYKMMAFFSPKRAKSYRNHKVGSSFVARSIHKLTLLALDLKARIYIGLVFQLIPLLVFAISYPTVTQIIVMNILVGIGDALCHVGIFPLGTFCSSFCA